MVKDIAIILKELGINLESETLLEDITNKLLEYSVVSESELLGIQSVSVQPLPTIIKNDEKNLKQRMVGIVSDQEKGAVSIINKRTVLLTKIVEALKNKVESFTDLGEINTTPTSEENDVLNNIKTKGVYSFNWSGFQYIMLVHTKRRKTLTGFIRVYEQYIFDGSRIIVRITNDSIDYWAVETNHIASKSDLDETKQEILNTLDTRLGNFKWLGDTNQDPSQTNNTFLNNITKPGFYAYDVYNMIHFMTVDNHSAQTGPNTSITIVTQHIFSTDRMTGGETIDNVDGKVTHTIRTLNNDVWKVKTEYLSTEEFVKQIENELLNKIAQINNDLSNLNNAKADKTYVNELLSMLPKFSIEVVGLLPTENISNTTVYLLQKSDGSDNIYEEYIYVNEKWELLGHARLDLSNYYNKSEADSQFVKKNGAENVYGIKTFYTLPETPMTPTKDNQLVSKKYVDYKVSEKDNYTYQAQVDGGTYPRIMKYDDDTLYLFTGNAYSVAYSVSKDGGRTWSERTVICSTILDSTDEIPVDDVANAFGILSPNNDGRVIVFYRAVNRDTSYFSIRCRVSDTTGHNFGDYKVLKTNDTGVWEPFYYEGYLYYSWEHERLGAQSQYRSKITVNGEVVTIGDGKMSIDGRKSTNLDGNTISSSRAGMLSISPLKSGGHIYVYENTVNKNASVPRPMVVQYAYGKTPEKESIGLTKMGTLFMGDEGITCGAPYVTTLDDGRIAISFQTDQYYEGIKSSTTQRNKQWVVYVSKRKVNFGDELTADDFVRLNNYSYGENEYGCWGSVQNIDGRLFNVFTLGKNKNETERLFVTNIVKELNVDNISTYDADYVTQTYVDEKLGDIQSLLEAI